MRLVTIGVHQVRGKQYPCTGTYGEPCLPSWRGHASQL